MQKLPVFFFGQRWIPPFSRLGMYVYAMVFFLSFELSPFSLCFFFCSFFRNKFTVVRGFLCSLGKPKAQSVQENKVK
jgi:hypothetical protein